MIALVAALLSLLGHPASTFRLDAPPVAVAARAGMAWVVVETTAHDAQLWQIDAATGKRLRSFSIGPAGPDIGAVAASEAGVWAAAGDHVIGVDPRHGRVRRARLPGIASGLAAGFGSVWATTIGSQGDLLVRLDQRSLAVAARIPAAGVSAVAVAAGSVWVAGTGSLARVDPRDNRMTNVLTTTSAAPDLVGSAQRLWLLDGARVLGLDRVGHLRRRLPLPFAASRISVSRGRLWAIDNCGCATGLLTALDLRTGRRLATWAVGATPVAVAADGGEVWVANFGNSTLSLVR
jgi:DNA-binding beta-propeller fold protein YncE